MSLLAKLRCIAALLRLPEPSASYPAPRLLQEACRQLGRPWTRSLKTSSLHRQCDAVLRALRHVERPSYVTALPPELQRLLLLHGPRFTTVCKWQDVLPGHELAWLRSMTDARWGMMDMTALRQARDACADPVAAMQQWRELWSRIDDVRKPCFVCHVPGRSSTFPLSVEGSVRLLQRTLRDTPEWRLTFHLPMVHPVRSVRNLADLSFHREGDTVLVHGYSPGRDTPAVWNTSLVDVMVDVYYLLQTHTSPRRYELPSKLCMWRPCEIRVFISSTSLVHLRFDTRM